MQEKYAPACKHVHLHKPFTHRIFNSTQTELSHALGSSGSLHHTIPLHLRRVVISMRVYLFVKADTTFAVYFFIFFYFFLIAKWSSFGLVCVSPCMYASVYGSERESE